MLGVTHAAEGTCSWCSLYVFALLVRTFSATLLAIWRYYIFLRSTENRCERGKKQKERNQSHWGRLLLSLGATLLIKRKSDDVDSFHTSQESGARELLEVFAQKSD
jgi:hypothetical protein